MKKIKIFLLLIFLITSCNAQKFYIKKEAAKILNSVLSDFNEPICLEKNTFFEHTNVEPNYLINNYFRVYGYSINKENNSIKESKVFYKIFLKDIDGVITKKELEKLKKKNLKWNKKEWKISEILNQKNVLITNSKIKANCKSKRLLKISEPVFTSDKNKAMILVKTLKNNTGSTFMKILKKEKRNWVIKGGIPIGTIN